MTTRRAPALLGLLLALALAAGAAPDFFGGKEWEPDFRAIATSRFQADSSGGATHLQVFTCLLSTDDLQLRRVDSPVPGADGSVEADSAGAACYRGEYEISLELFSGEGRERRSAASRYERFEFTLDRAGRDAPGRQRWHHFEVELPPGEYGWWVEFQDLNSRRSKRLDGELVVEDPAAKAWALSGLWLLADVDSLKPDPLSARLFVEEKGGAHPDQLTVYYEIWTPVPVELELKTRILDRRDRSRHERVLVRSFDTGISRNLLQVPLAELGSGDYRVELDLREPGAKPEKKRFWFFGGGDDPARARSRTAPFSVRWRGEPGTPRDLELAVEQLRYVMPRKRFKELQDSPMGYKHRLFEEFWATLDPTPDSDRNEMMQEYYRRAEFADRRFSWSRFAGWRSDRGRVYMIHGDPDEIERQEGDLDRPSWERWSYRESGRSFLFVDRQGFGDYQLVIEP